MGETTLIIVIWKDALAYFCWFSYLSTSFSIKKLSKYSKQLSNNLSNPVNILSSYMLIVFQLFDYDKYHWGKP